MHLHSVLELFITLDPADLAFAPDPAAHGSQGALTRGAAVQVWYPDSADKTAQALEEFDREGLPLVILANWRGFSGGQRDLFEGVLQAGSCIVEALRKYRWPVMVYLPPGCELRGGAWVVIDSMINSSAIEMYAGVNYHCELLCMHVADQTLLLSAVEM